MATKKKELSGFTVSNCTFTGAHFDAKAVDTITLISEACKANAGAITENARVLSKLAEVLKASNIEIDSMLKITGDEVAELCK